MNNCYLMKVEIANTEDRSSHTSYCMMFAASYAEAIQSFTEQCAVDSEIMEISVSEIVDRADNCLMLTKQGYEILSTRDDLIIY